MAIGATGLLSINGLGSGFFNTGVPEATFGPGSSGGNSALFNVGTDVTGLFNLSRSL